ncbi:T9SS type B sorting domain-containing protein [Sediminicola sp. 1XM1-17]|uniref:T9SS type B sorting domain-containing protein n=1 Tax=Sediminicola sp. 1XM1-17 TaxID=3127702 RepID=UPI0030771A51
MEKRNFQRHIILFLLALFWSSLLQAQLGFCPGSKGDPIFEEDFGTGTTNGPALPAGTTTYTYTSGAPDDGFYTLSSTTNYFSWHDTQDHTPNDTDGKALIINADINAGEFFRYRVDALCENTTYAFSSWLLNLLPLSGCLNNGIPVNVDFEIWDDTDTQLLASGNTGDIIGTTSPRWQQYGLVFQTLGGQTSVILKMINNAPGGCGNDLAIDDIVFRTCGDLVEITDLQNETEVSVCEADAPVTIDELNATPDFSVYSTHAFQWQSSTSSSTWADIPGETNPTYSPGPISESTFFRVKVAEDPINLASPLCSSVSEVFKVLIVNTPSAPTSTGDVMACSNEPKPLEVTTLFGIKVNWYDAPTGGNLLLADSHTYQPTENGTFYAEAETTVAGCISDTRTPVSIFFYQLPEVEDETVAFCENSQTTLYANYIGTDMVTYEWNTGETTSQITVDAPGTYTVGVTNSDGCTKVKTITLEQVDAPVISNIGSDEFSIIVSTSAPGDFEYSLDGTFFQDSPELENVPGGRYTVYVREKNGCGEDSRQYTHFVIPKFFTPNGDFVNDTFDLTGIENYDSSQVNIFDRYGKLLKNSRNTQFSWDGTFNSRDLPSGDYWYVIQIEDTVFKGHFSLKR